MQCARHTKVETELACGRCGTPICPRCLVYTDVGVRCPECAPRRKLPQLEVGPLYLWRGGMAALASGAALGFIWRFILPPGVGGLGFIGIILALGMGYLISEAVSVAANRKRGVPLQVVAAMGVFVAYVTRNLVAQEAIVPTDDFVGYIFVIIAAAVAVTRLRWY